MPKKTPEEILRALERTKEDDAADDAEMERVLGLSDEEVNAELAKAGYTEEELEAEEARLFGPKPAAAAPKPASEPPPKSEDRPRTNVVPLRPRRRGLLAPIAAAAAMLGPVGFLALTELAEPLALVGAAPDSGAASAEAEALRNRAAEALEAGQWSRCLALLDLAKQKDPQGDRAPAVQDARRIATRKLGVQGDR